MSRLSLRGNALDRLRRARAAAEQPVPPPRQNRPFIAPPDPHPVPKTIRNAAEWSWRFLLIAAAVVVMLMGLGRVSAIVVPLLVAILLTALLQPIYRFLARALPTGLAAGLTVLTLVLILSGAFTIIGRTLSNGLGDVTDQVLQGIEEIRAWTRDTFGISNSQIDEYIARAREAVTDGSAEGAGPLLSQVGLTAGHFVAGFFIALFALFFFLYDGARIWGWIVALFPRGSRDGVHEAGRLAWAQLSSFTRATILVALADAIGITAVALVLGVPFPAVIFLLVLIGAFIPIIGGGLSGTVAVLLALVANGPLTALLMLAGVIAVQQIESHLLQPLLLGRVMRLHPLGVIIAIAAGIVLAGITGALIAVPLVAVFNAVGKYYLTDDISDLEEVADDLPELDAVAASPPDSSADLTP